MIKKLNLEWLGAALNRAVRTMAQTALSMFTVGAALNEINWVRILSISVVAGLYSILTSVATNLPEASGDGTLLIDTTDPEKDIYRMELNVPFETLATRTHVTFKVNSEAQISNSQE